jgi:major membrane immunogen (membrane-anchored lipoprotein)
MKNQFHLSTIVFLFILFISTSVSAGQEVKAPVKAVQDSLVTYKDGTYEGRSRAKYIYEPYWGSVKITLKNGQLSDIKFVIRDSNAHEKFDENYEKHFIGNPEYIQQSRNDWKGAQTYPQKLSEKQDINKVDAISGATWSYNLFKASINDALKNAR